MAFSIIKPGLLDTIQDMGRNGFGNWGINPGGAMDGDRAEAPEFEGFGVEGSGGEESEGEEPRKKLHAAELIVCAVPKGIQPIHTLYRGIKVYQ